MEWNDFWQKLLLEKKLFNTVDEMDNADLQLGRERLTEEICHNIYEDYKNWYKNLASIKKEFLDEIDKIAGVHLQSSRIKTKESLIAKVIVKRHENLLAERSDYAHIDGNNYKDIVTDLIGMRLIINYRGKWTDIHEAILQLFPYKTDGDYSVQGLYPHESDGASIQVEKPKAYYAAGDDFNQYAVHGLEAKRHTKGYRSIHYTVSYKFAYIEIQVRTIYDEAWSDCDHNYVYKQEFNKSHGALEQLSAILCSLTNAANDIGENMREIFEGELIAESNANKWQTNQKCIDYMDYAISRVEDVSGKLTEFRNKLVCRK